MAVDRALRGAGVARQLIEALQQAAAKRGDRRVVLSAQRSAEGFYRRLGYEPVGEPYEEVGIAHIGNAARAGLRFHGSRTSTTGSGVEAGVFGHAVP